MGYHPPMFVQVALPIPKRLLFTYALPPGLTCQPGTLVLAPVGRGERLGVVWSVGGAPEWDGEIRPISRILEEKPLLDPDLLHLLEWMSRYYMRPIGAVLAAALPGHLRFERRVSLVWCGDERPAGGDEAPPVALQPLAWRIRERKKLTPETLARHFGRTGLDSRLNALIRAGWIRREERWLPRGGAAGGGEGEAGAGETGAGETGAGAGELVAPPPELNDEQKICVARLAAALDAGRFQPFLLDGVTGSGKTEVYFRAVERCLENGRQALLLVPEIALTPQMIRRYRARFGSGLAIFHSGLGAAERLDHWRRIRDGRARVALGARSAIFAPFARLGLIVVDEEHDGSYKQEGTVPYQGRDMAVVRARRAGAVLILGSATPSLESLHNVEQGRYERLVLTRRATGMPAPTMVIIPLADAAVREGMSFNDLISPPLQRAIEETLARERQVLLFLNRRGFAPSLLCRRCGQAVTCPNCSVTLTLHRKSPRLLCHYCDHWQAVADVCTACGQLSLFHFGPGTERLEKEARKKFPQARLARLDRDTVTAKVADPEAVLNGFRDGQLDMLLGTQMIAKGHHFPKLALVGVVQAETGLCQPDFRAAERTFQLLTQVAGRAGREEAGARVLIQSYDPDHYALRAVLDGDAGGFAETEKAFRRQAGYPPCQRLALIRFSTLVQAEGERFGRLLKAQLPDGGDAQFLGPAQAPIFRLRNRYRWQVLVKERPGGRLHRALEPVMARAEQLAGQRIRLEVDVDPHAFL